MVYLLSKEISDKSSRETLYNIINTVEKNVAEIEAKIIVYNNNYNISYT